MGRGIAVQKEQFINWVQGINQEELPIIVEGRHDKRALRNIGIIVPIVLYNAQPLYKLIEYIAENFSKIIILTDNDKEGRRLYGCLTSELTRKGVYIDKKYREFLQRETQLNQIEGIERYYKRVLGEPAL